MPSAPPGRPEEADDITPEQVTRLLEQLAEQFQYVIVDTAPGFPEVGWPPWSSAPTLSG